VGAVRLALKINSRSGRTSFIRFHTSEGQMIEQSIQVLSGNKGNNEGYMKICQ
jgi:hypothetical protein